MRSFGIPMIFNLLESNSVLTRSKAILRSRLAMTTKHFSSAARAIIDCKRAPAVAVLLFRGVKFVCLFVTNFDLNYLLPGRIVCFQLNSSFKTSTIRKGQLNVSLTLSAKDHQSLQQPAKP